MLDNRAANGRDSVQGFEAGRVPAKQETGLTVKESGAADGKVTKEFYSKLVKADAHGRIRILKSSSNVQEIFSFKLSGDPKLGEGKPENQNHAIVFTRGEVVQIIHMNQHSIHGRIQPSSTGFTGTRLGGLNCVLAGELSPSLPVISKVPTLILGMDVSHGSPGQSDVPSITAVISSRQWPSISRYRACVRTLRRELRVDLYQFSKKETRPDYHLQMVSSESQFNQVLNIELDMDLSQRFFDGSNWNLAFGRSLILGLSVSRVPLPLVPAKTQQVVSERLLLRIPRPDSGRTALYRECLRRCLQC
ncbi:hypothetical protein CASFOL_031040 [Castilleja foliolosa]|uniref:Uncharacterized protein n=1 Tax=Castilleja foliolosa TaxID=1961234 RepID=A0ABD3C497_9LAMI